MSENKRKDRIVEIEALMSDANFWSDKEGAKKLIKELQDLKITSEGGGKYDGGDAVMNIYSGAGGDDAEDFAGMLASMYAKYISGKGWIVSSVYMNENDHGGIKSATYEIKGKGVYGTLKNESGVHRLVRLSPFNAKNLRQTSFVMIEIIPKFDKNSDISIDETDLKIDFARSGGPGGQNVNKRETAVRIVHVPTKISVHVDSERSQAQNKEKAMEILKGKLYVIMEEKQKKEEAGSYVSKTTDNEWGNQIRSYVLHPYKLVKDHRTGIEMSNAEDVLKNGLLDKFIEAEKNI